MLSRAADLAPAVTSRVIQVGAIAGGSALALYGLKRGGWVGLGALVAGAAVVARSGRLTRRRYANGCEARAAVTILADPQTLYERLRPKSLSDLLSFVTRIDERTNGDEIGFVIARGWGGPRRWIVRIVEDAPDRTLAWRSTPDSPIPGWGRIRLIPAPGDRGTEVHVRLFLGPPAGGLGAVLAGEVGNSGEPGVSLQDDLVRFKQLVEAEEVATTVGQPRGAGKQKLRSITARDIPERFAAAHEEVR
jgi:uncharacterized membrane protein